MSKMCNVQCEVCSVQCTVCRVQCAVCSVQCAMCSAKLMHGLNLAYNLPSHCGQRSFQVIVEENSIFSVNRSVDRLGGFPILLMIEISGFCGLTPFA